MVLAAPAASATPSSRTHIQHVLLLSIDGLHEVDVANCIAAHICPNLAALAGQGVTYTDAYTTRPSDSFPGTIGELTGGRPRTTGVYYDDTFDRSLFPPSSDCKGPPGSEVRLTGHLDRDSSRLDGGSPAGLDGDSAAAVDTARLPEIQIGSQCRPLWPHDYLRVNTAFGVLHSSGLRTAWIDKHPAFETLNGPGAPAGGPGHNIDDFFAPEIDAALNGENLGKTAASASDVAQLSNARRSFAGSIAAVQLYDELKVRAILEEIDGRDHAGGHRLGTPALFGMNFQSVNVAQKSPAGAYRDTRATPRGALLGAIEHVDGSIE